MNLEQVRKDLLHAMQQEQIWHDRANYLRGQISVLEAQPSVPPPISVLEAQPSVPPPNRAERRRSNGRIDPTPDPTPGP